MINLATENKVCLRVVVGLKFIVFNSATAHTLTVSKYNNTTMDIFDNQEFYKRIDQLIRLKATGNPTEFSRKLGISESHLYRIIRKMKEQANCPIVYSKQKRSYMYEYRGRLNIKFCFENLQNDYLKKVKGGYSKINFLLSKNESQTNYSCNC